MTYDCTGERYKNEAFHLQNIEGWHGKFGHCNVLKLDHNSVITGKGKHDRVICFLPDGEGLYCRIDHVWGLNTPTHAEILKVARIDQGVKGRWKFDRSEIHDDGRATDYYFTTNQVGE